MAEIRKHKQSNSAIAQAIEAAMGESVRPVTPGAPPRPGEQGDGRQPGQSTRPGGAGIAAVSTAWSAFTVPGVVGTGPQSDRQVDDQDPDAD